MARFSYSAETPGGGIERGSLDAESDAAALAALRSKSLSPLELSLSPTRTNDRGRKARMRAKYTEQLIGRLAQLLIAGVPLAEALRLMSDSGGVVGSTAQQLLSAVRGGATLQHAVENLPHAMPPEVVAIVGIGEETGTLGPQLQRLSADLTKTRAREREIIGQLIYPAALFILMIGTVFFLAHVILPEFEVIYQSGSAAPPPETAFVLNAGKWVRAWGWLVPAGIVSAIVGVRMIARQNPKWSERALLNTPLIGWFLKRRDAARFCRSLGVLLSSGADLAASLPIARKPVALSVLRDAHARAAESVRGGVPVAAGMKAETLLPRDALELITIGENSGRLGPMLIEAAQLIEDDLSSTLKRVSALTGPVLTALMGLMTAGVIAAVMSGVLSLNEAVF